MRKTVKNNKDLWRIFVVLLVCVIYNIVSFMKTGVWNNDTINMSIVVISTMVIIGIIRRLER